MKKLTSFKVFLSAIKKTIKIKQAILHEPSFDKNEYKELQKAIKSKYVSNTGKAMKVDEFALRIKKITKSKFVIPVINGTSALHIILRSLKINHNHEVLLPSLGFVAAANAILYQNAEPHFVDSEYNNLGVDPVKLYDYLKRISIVTNKGCINKKTKKIIKCLIVTHIFGHSAKILELKKVCKLYKIILIEDAAEALGTRYRGKHIGNFGLLSALSFNGNKIVTTGGGGAILTNNKKLFELCKHISSTSKIKHDFEFIFDQIGYNYRLPSLNAALGCAQLKKINIFIKKKRRLYQLYKKNFQNIEFARIFSEPKKTKSNYWLQTIILNKNSLRFRNDLIKFLNRNGVGARPVWKLLHKLKFLKNYQKMNLTHSLNLEKNIINLPSGPDLIK